MIFVYLMYISIAKSLIVLLLIILHIIILLDIYDITSIELMVSLSI